MRREGEKEVGGGGRGTDDGETGRTRGESPRKLFGDHADTPSKGRVGWEGYE